MSKSEAERELKAANTIQLAMREGRSCVGRIGKAVTHGCEKQPLTKVEGSGGDREEDGAYGVRSISS